MIGNRYLSAIIAVLCVSCPYVQSQDTDSRVSPLYFGPNALPVPEMLDGKVYERLHTEIAFDLHMGYHGDLTETVFVKLNIPLFSSRVNLSLWMPVVEFYSNTAESLAWQDPQVRSLKGTAIGKLYISTDIQLLRQTRTRPDIVVRAAIVTASEDTEKYARFFWANSTLLVYLGENQIPANQTNNRDSSCGRRDSNPYALRHQILSLAWLPITTRPQTMVCKDKDKFLFCNIFHGRLSGAFPVAHMQRISVLAEIKAAPALHGVFPCQDKPCPGRRFCEHGLVFCEESAHEKHASSAH